MSSRLSRVLVIAPVVAAGVLVAGSAHAAVPTAVDLGTLGGSWSLPTAINGTGDVVGNSETADGSVHAFLARASGIGDLGTLRGYRSEAVGVNSYDAVVGVDLTSAGGTLGFIWRHGHMISLGTLGGAASAPAAVNDSNWVVGSSMTSGGRTHAFLWKHGVMLDLAPNNACSRATAINNHNEIVGVLAYAADNCQRWHPFLWRNGALEKLRIRYPFEYPGPPPGPGDFPYLHRWNVTINARGAIGGVYTAYGNSGSETVLSALFRWRDGVVTFSAERYDVYATAVWMNARGDILANTAWCCGFDAKGAIVRIGSSSTAITEPQPVTAYGIDNKRRVLASHGNVLSPSLPVRYFRWRAGVAHYFTSKAPVYASAGAVNPRGDIVTAWGDPAHATRWIFA